MTLLKSSSRTGSRRSKAARGCCLLLFLLAAGAAAADAQSLGLGVTSGAEGIRVSLAFHWNKENDLVTSLRDGMESRIVFTLRVWEKRSGFLPLFRDRVILETTVARSAFWDFLDKTFVVESDDGARAVFQNGPDLLRGFFTLTDYPLLHAPSRPGQLRYVTARARLEPVRLMPPLTIVTLAGAAASYTTAWERQEAQ